jgi:hypothetical protein
VSFLPEGYSMLESGISRIDGIAINMDPNLQKFISIVIGDYVPNNIR